MRHVFDPERLSTWSGSCCVMRVPITDSFGSGDRSQQNYEHVYLFDEEVWNRRYGLLIGAFTMQPWEFHSEHNIFVG